MRLQIFDFHIIKVHSRSKISIAHYIPFIFSVIKTNGTLLTKYCNTVVFFGGGGMEIKKGLNALICFGCMYLNAFPESVMTECFMKNE